MALTVGDWLLGARSLVLMTEIDLVSVGMVYYENVASFQWLVLGRGDENERSGDSSC